MKLNLEWNIKYCTNFSEEKMSLKSKILLLDQGLVDELKTEAKQRKSDFGNSGRSGFHPGIFSNGFGEFSTMKKNEMKNIASATISTTGKLLKS